MASPDFSTLSIREVSKPVAREMIVNNHYSHKWNTLFGVVNYGIFKGDELLGVAAYGHPMNPTSWAAVAELPAGHCLELNRLWIDDALGANTETWFMGQTFKHLRASGYELVQSFADGRLGVGTIYQAANFTYHGYHTTAFHRDTKTGTVYHGTPFSNTAKAASMVRCNALFPAGCVETFQTRTYRYLYPLNKKARRAVKLPSHPYPKERTGEMVIKDYRPPVGQVARATALAEVMGDPNADALRDYLGTLTDDPLMHLATQRENRWVRKIAEQQEPPGAFLDPQGRIVA